MATKRRSLRFPISSVAARAYPVAGGRLQRGGIDLTPLVRDGRIEWTAPEGEWELCVVRAERQANTINPLLAGVGEIVIRDFYQRFQDATPNKSHEGLNYFFNDELQLGAGPMSGTQISPTNSSDAKDTNCWRCCPRSGMISARSHPRCAWTTPMCRMALMEERYFQPIYRWHASRGLIFACDSGGRGLQPDEFGDYFRATRWYTAPGHDTPGGHADLIKGKVSSSIAGLYRRPRVWLEGYHSLGWGATPERLMYATRENYLYGCTLLNLHGLYYTTHGSFWEWAPPCYHFRMPYWEHMGVFLKYFERLSYLLSQGTFVCDVAVVYPVAPYEAGLDGKKATAHGVRHGHRPDVRRHQFRVHRRGLAGPRAGPRRPAGGHGLFLPRACFAGDGGGAMVVVGKSKRVCRGGGLVLNVGTLPFASDRAGRDDAELDGLVAATFPIRIGSPSLRTCPPWFSARDHARYPSPEERPFAPPQDRTARCLSGYGCAKELDCGVPGQRPSRTLGPVDWVDSALARPERDRDGDDG